MTELEPGLALSAGGSYWFYSLCGYLPSSPSLKVRTSPEWSLDSCYLSRVWPPLGSPELGLVEFFLFQTIKSPHFGLKALGAQRVGALELEWLLGSCLTPFVSPDNGHLFSVHNKYAYISNASTTCGLFSFVCDRGIC